jgi:F0F1-type ATP synthase epsilon subunit
LANTFLAEIITPERVLFRAPVENVTLGIEEGAITFLANHADYLAAVDITLVKLYVATEAVTNDWIASYRSEHASKAAKSPLVGVNVADLHASEALLVLAAVHGGFVHVTKEGLRIFSPVAELAWEIDTARVEAVLSSISDSDEPSSESLVASDQVEAASATGEGSQLSILSASKAARAILLPDSKESRIRRALVRKEAVTTSSTTI